MICKLGTLRRVRSERCECTDNTLALETTYRPSAGSTRAVSGSANAACGLRIQTRKQRHVEMATSVITILAQFGSQAKEMEEARMKAARCYAVVTRKIAPV